MAKPAYHQELVGVTLSDKFQAIRRREKAIPTLGNPTQLNMSVNHEAQNQAFTVKKSLLITNTVLSINGGLMAQDAWNEEAISIRAKILADAAMQLHPR